MSETSELSQPENTEAVSRSPQENSSRRQRIMKIVNRFFGRKSSDTSTIAPSPRKNEFSTVATEEVSYQEAQKRLFQERLAESTQDYRNMLDELIRSLPDDKTKADKTKKLEEKYQAKDPVIMKMLTLYLIDQNKFNTAQRNIEINKANRELANQAMKRGEDPGEKIPQVDVAEKAAKVALYKNLQATFDLQLRKQFQGKEDHRADAAFASRDLNLALRGEPLFEEPAEKTLLNQTADREVSEALVAGNKPLAERKIVE